MISKLPVFAQVLLGAIALTIGGILLLPGDEHPYQNDQLPWNSHVDQKGQVHALGLTIGQSTLADAMARYGKDVEIKLFTDAELNPTSVEAYFPTIYIGAIKSPLILRLKVDYARMQALMNEAPGVRATPTGNKEVLLSDFQARSLLNTPIEAMTLVVKKHLPEQALIKRFGEPLEKITAADKTIRWRYPHKGLEIIIDPEGGPTVLEWAEIFTRQP
jgi:hypothetical protein